ncbi:MAG TPA: OB-fold domain-containing protein [Acidimicrobiales bacterium]
MSGAAAPERRGDRPNRPRPALTEDNAWWFEACRRHRLLIQRCTACGVLRHPPEPACGTCQSFEWDTVDASGQGTVYSFVVNHHPQVAAFDYPFAVGLIELEEGTRLVANVIGIEPAGITVGLPVEVVFVDHDPDLSLPAFRPAG